MEKGSDSKKSVWIICQNAGSIHHGMVYRPYFLAREFVAKGYQVTIFASSSSHLLYKKPKVPGLFLHEEIDGIDYVWLKTREYKSSRSIGRVLNFFEFPFKLLFMNPSFVPHPQTVIAFSPSPFSIINAYFLSRRFSCKFFIDIRDIWPLTLIKLGRFSRWNPLIMLMRFIEKFGYKTADAVVSVLKNSKTYLIESGMAAQKFYYIPNGVKLGDGDIAPKSMLVEKLPKDKFIVGYVGSLGFANDTIKLLEAAEHLKMIDDLFFVIVGQGEEKENLVRYAKDRHLNSVNFFDPIPKIEVHSLLLECDLVFVGTQPSELYSHGISLNKIFDYMYARKPIIMSISTSHDIIGEANCGITIKDGNSQSIAKAIMDMHALTKEERARLGYNGYRFLLANHSYEKLADDYIKLLEAPSR